MARAALPEELKESILVYACSLPRNSQSEVKEYHVRNTRVSDLLGNVEAVVPGTLSTLLFPAPTRTELEQEERVELDTEMVTQVMQLSQKHYTLGAQLLYRAPVLRRPSQLMQLARTLSSRPVLGRMVRHLYVGTTTPRTELPMSFFQGGLASYERGLSLAPEFRGVGGRNAHPCEPNGSLLPHVTEHDMAEVCALFVGPPGAWGFDIYRPGFDRDDEWIGKGAWVLRLHEARCLLHWARALAYQARLEEATKTTNLDEFYGTLRKEAEDASVNLAAFLEGQEPSEAYDLLQRRTGTRHDPLDWDDTAATPAPIPDALPVDQHESLVALQWRILAEWPQEWMAQLPRWLCVLLAQAIAHGQWAGRTCTPAERKAILGDTYRTDARLVHARQCGASFFTARDRFDDPCLYARSGVMHFLIGNELGNPAQAQQAQRDTTDFWVQPGQSLDGDPIPPTIDQMVLASFAPRPLGLAPSLLSIPGKEPRHTDIPLPSAEPTLPPTLGGLIATVQSVLSLTPNLESLGLSGVLERVVAGQRCAMSLPHLDRVYLGPPPPYWAHPLLFGDAHHPAFAYTRHISITGCLLFQDEAASLAGAFGALPNLESVTWSMFHSTWEEGAHSVIAALSTMLAPSRSQYKFPGRCGVGELTVVLHAVDYEAVRTNAPAHLLEHPRLRLRCAPKEYIGQNHAIFTEWATEVYT